MKAVDVRCNKRTDCNPAQSRRLLESHLLALNIMSYLPFDHFNIHWHSLLFLMGFYRNTDILVHSGKVKPFDEQEDYTNWKTFAFIPPLSAASMQKASTSSGCHCTAQACQRNCPVI